MHAHLLKPHACALRKTPRLDRIILDGGCDRIGCVCALVGQAAEFLRRVLAPRLLGDVPVETGVGAQPFGEIFRIGHEALSAVEPCGPCTQPGRAVLIRIKVAAVALNPRARARAA